MAKKVPITDRIILNMKRQVNDLKTITGWTDEELGRRCGVSRQTIHNLKTKPSAVNGSLVLLVQEMLSEEQEKVRKGRTGEL